MREIKFRAWLWSDNHTNDQWIYSDKLGMIKFWRSFYSWTAHKDLMQFTGLNDKNGKEIYEGDIVVKFDLKDPFFRSKVVYQDGAFGYFDDIGGFISYAENSNFKWSNNQSEHLVVIGNIYDNPELLEVEG